MNEPLGQTRQSNQSNADLAVATRGVEAMGEAAGEWTRVVHADQGLDRRNLELEHQVLQQQRDRDIEHNIEHSIGQVVLALLTLASGIGVVGFAVASILHPVVH